MLREKISQEGRPGGTEGNKEALDFFSQCRIVIWNYGGLWNITISTCKDLGYDILGLKETDGWNSDPGAISLHFKYLDVMQSGDGDPQVPVNHRVTNAWSRFRYLRSVLTDAKLPTSLRLGLFGSSKVSALVYGCESWKLTDKAARKLTSAYSKMLSKILIERSLMREERPLSTFYHAPETLDGTRSGMF